MLEQVIQVTDCGYLAASQYHAMSRARPQDWLVIWVWSGSGRAYMGAQEHIAAPGDLLCFRPDISHTYYADPDQPWEIYWAHLRGQVAGVMVDRIAPGQRLAVPLGLDPVIRDRFMEVVVAFHAPVVGAADLANAECIALLGRMVHRLAAHSRSPVSQLLAEMHDLQKYIHQHLAEPLSLADLADRACLSPNHFARQFKQLFGMSPIRYLIQHRIGRACLLLEETAMPIKQICRAVGYEDQYYFSRLFKKQTGQTPTEFRRQCRLRQQ